MPERILIRATNWVGDAVMSVPALRAIREAIPSAHLTVLARPWVADIYARETSIDEVIPYHAARGVKDWAAKWRLAGQLRAMRFDCAILLQNAFEAALLMRLAGIPRRIGYNRDGRGWLLTSAVAVPKLGETPRHERFYYLELLRRAGIIAELPPCDAIRLDGASEAAAAGAEHCRARHIALPAIGVSPGAAYGNAKRWIAEYFAESASRLAAEQQASVILFGSGGERELCETVAASIAARGIAVHNLAGATTLREFIELAAACRLFLTNDSGGMHIASALGVPTVAVFGATDDRTTGPTGPLASVVREPVECSPCLLRECPLDHRCMTRVPPERVVDAALNLLKEPPIGY
ncbi:MAG: lipopolysaccharide heptosyltransferase II [Bryobacteraceae bacterium]